MVRSTHRFPESEFTWLVPPGTAISAECGNSRRTSRLSGNGVSGSSVSSVSSALLKRLPLTRIGA